MLIHDDIYSWEGWGGKLKLGSGKCRLRIYDLRKGDAKGVSHLKPFIVIVSDLPNVGRSPNKMTIKSCASHIATHVVRDFNLDPNRMVWVEYYEKDEYGGNLKPSEKRFDEAEFTWHDDKALNARWRPLNRAVANLVKEMVSESSSA